MRALLALTSATTIKCAPKFEHKVFQATLRSLEFLLSKQYNHGGFYGSWGICFTYGTWFGCEGITAGIKRIIQERKNVREREENKVFSLSLRESFSIYDALLERCEQALCNSINFLLSIEKQNQYHGISGGWCESWESCVELRPMVPASGPPDAVQTAWAMMALMAAATGLREIHTEMTKTEDGNNNGIKGEREAKAKAKAKTERTTEIETEREKILALNKTKCQDQGRNPSYILMKAKIQSAIKRSVKVLLKLQKRNGDWPTGIMTGVFNKTVTIAYPNYRYFVF